MEDLKYLVPKKPDWLELLKGCGSVYDQEFCLNDWWYSEFQSLVDELEKAEVVTSANGIDWNDEEAINNKYKAYLIGVQSIEPDNFEKLVKDLVKVFDPDSFYNTDSEAYDILKRAKKLLRESNKKKGGNE